VFVTAWIRGVGGFGFTRFFGTVFSDAFTEVGGSSPSTATTSSTT
jgi:hypothetical protein